MHSKHVVKVAQSRYATNTYVPKLDNIFKRQQEKTQYIKLC